MPIADYEGGLGTRASGHGMDIKQKGIAMLPLQMVQAVSQGLMVGTMNLLDASFQFLAVDRPSPKLAVALGARRHKAKPVACAGPDRGRAYACDRARVDFLLASIAVDHGARDILYHSADAGPKRAPAKPVHQRILKRLKRP